MAKDKTSARALVVLRVAFGWLFLYSGYTKLTGDFSAEGFLTNAKSLKSLYTWFASEGNLPWVNFLNVWGQLLIGLGLILGAFTRFASYAGALLMVLYYFPSLDFPYVEHGYLIDDHIIYALAFLVLATNNAGHHFGLDSWLKKKLGWKCI